MATKDHDHEACECFTCACEGCARIKDDIAHLDYLDEMDWLRSKYEERKEALGRLFGWDGATVGAPSRGTSGYLLRAVIGWPPMGWPPLVIVRCDDRDDDILVGIAADKVGLVDIAGWIRVADAKRDEWLRDDSRVWVVPVTELRDITTLPPIEPSAQRRRLP